MAELHVQRKERSVWPWILAALVLLGAIAWMLWGRGDNFDVAAGDATDSSLVAVDPNIGVRDSAAGMLAGTAVTEYLQFVDGRSSRVASQAHEYTSNGLRQLAAALDEIAVGDSAGGVAVQPRVREIRERADAMQQNRNSNDHALQAREAFVLASSLIAQMRGMGAAGDTDALQQAATAIEPSRPLLDQSNQIEQFFEQAGAAIRRLSNATMQVTQAYISR